MISDADLIWTKLLDKRMDFCRDRARRLTARAIELGRSTRNAGPRADTAEGYRYNELCQFGEAAAMIYLSPVTWLFQIEGDVHGLCDLEHEGFEMDVKTRGQHHYDLVIQEDQSPDWIYILATAPEPPIVCLRAWCWGHDGMTESYKGTRAPVAGSRGFWIPQNAPILRPMRELRAFLHGPGAR